MPKHEFKGQLEEFSYALGVSISGNLIQSGVKSIDSENFMMALSDVFSGNELKINEEEANEVLQNFMEKQQSGDSKSKLEEGLSFLAENREKDGVVETASGLQYQVIDEGDGEKPGPEDQVKCHYHGTLIDGTVFDSSVQRGEPATFPVNGVIQGWVEALQMMTVGSKWRLFIPADLAYGDRGAGGAIGPNTTLIFDVELLEIV